MLFKKFQLVVFRDNQGCYRKLQIRAWHVLTIAGLYFALIGGNIHFWQYYVNHSQLATNLQTTEKTVTDQKKQLVSLANKIQSLEKDLHRIRDFDSKLRAMINLDQEPVEAVVSVGGPGKDFADGYLPIYRQELLARKMHNFLHQLRTDVRMEEIRQQELVRAIEINKDILASTPSIWPTEGWISSGFGERISPFTGQPEFHKGIDISGKLGTPIYTPADGVITFAGVDNAYGKSVAIDHGAGIVTRFAHLQHVNVKKGEKIKRGQCVGELGNSGRSTGPHLHYEVRLGGVYVNPMRYILN